MAAETRIHRSVAVEPGDTTAGMGRDGVLDEAESPRDQNFSIGLDQDIANILAEEHPLVGKTETGIHRTIRLETGDAATADAGIGVIDIQKLAPGNDLPVRLDRDRDNKIVETLSIRTERGVDRSISVETGDPMAGDGSRRIRERGEIARDEDLSVRKRHQGPHGTTRTMALRTKAGIDGAVGVETGDMVAAIVTARVADRREIPANQDLPIGLDGETIHRAVRTFVVESEPAIDRSIDIETDQMLPQDRSRVVIDRLEGPGGENLSIGLNGQRENGIPRPTTTGAEAVIKIPRSSEGGANQHGESKGKQKRFHSCVIHIQWKKDFSKVAAAESQGSPPVFRSPGIEPEGR